MLPPRLNNRIAGSTLTLPVTIIAGIAVWATGIAEVWTVVPEFLITLFITYVLMETDNRYALMRVRTRIVPSIFFVALTILADGVMPVRSYVLATMILLSVAALFKCYERADAALHVFHSYLCLGVAICLMPSLTIYIPLYWFFIAGYLRAMSLRNMSASILALALGALGYVLFTTDWYWLTDIITTASAHRYDAVYALSSAVLSRYTSIVQTFSLPDTTEYITRWQTTVYGISFTDKQTLSWIIATIWGCVGICHYGLRCYDDKIRTRMYIYIMCVIWYTTQVLIVAQPWHLSTLLPMLWITTALFTGHHWATSRSLLTMLWCCTFVLASIICYIIRFLF